MAVHSTDFTANVKAITFAWPAGKPCLTEELKALLTQVPPVTDSLERPEDPWLDLGPQHGHIGPQSYFWGLSAQHLVRSRQRSVVRH